MTLSTTSNNTKIFQIYFKPELKDKCDPAFEPYDNTANPRPELREWDVWDREHETRMSENLDYWGYVSWKFSEKMGITGQQAMDYIKANPGYEVYIFNPCIANEALFANSWEQGEIYHTGICEIGNKFLARIGHHNEPEVAGILLDRTRTVYANYVVGNRKFWDAFMKFTRQIFTEADKDPDFKEAVFGAGHSNYAHDPSLPMFTFLIERLLPTFLEIFKFEVCPYVYTDETIPEKYKPYLGDIQALSNLKVLVNVYNSDELFKIWNHFRMKVLHTTPQILQLE